MNQEFEHDGDLIFMSNDKINNYLEECYQRDLAKMNNGELEEEHIQYVEDQKIKKYRLLGDKLFNQALE